MFEGKNEQEARQEILSAVQLYAQKYHNQNRKYQLEKRIPYAARVYDSKEMVNLVDSALDFWLTAGRYVDEFEESFAKFLGIKYCSLVNSGSSANLLAFMALTSPLLGERKIERGDEVITVAAGFPTTVAPIVQYGAIPVFVDITIPQYNIDTSMLENAYSSKTKAVMLAHTLGNPFDLNSVKAFCDKHQLWLIEDNCDALGSKYILDEKEYYTGTVGDIGTSSFYPPHHMTMGEGGAVYTNNPLLHKCIRTLRDWGRDCTCASGQDNLCGNRFNRQYGELPEGYDHKYVYSHLGYNLKATEMQAAVGCAQLKKLSGFIEKRIINHNKITEGLDSMRGKLILPEACENAVPSWFGYAVTCKNGLERTKVVRYLEASGIQTRMLFAGNIVKHPCFSKLKKSNVYRIIGKLENTDRILEKTFWVGVYPGLTDEMINCMIQAIKEGIER